MRPDAKKLKIPRYWIRPPQPLSAERGIHRFLWDIHYTSMTGIEPDYPMAAVYRDTPPASTSPWVMPGDYAVVLTASGKSYSQPLTVKMDPRVKMSAVELQEQLQLSQQLCEIRAKLEPIGKTFDSLVEQLMKIKEEQPLSNNVEDKLNGLTAKLKELAPPNPRPGAPPSLHALESVKTLFDVIQGVEAPATNPVKAAVGDVRLQATSLMERWEQIISQDVPALNKELEAARLPRINPAP
jgi:hypothetical protein